jgi:hypothetical protein
MPVVVTSPYVVVDSIASTAVAVSVEGRKYVITGVPAASRCIDTRGARRSQAGRPLAVEGLSETNAFRTDAAVHLFVPWIVRTFSTFSFSMVSSSDIRAG